jgi:hypothetical protein
MEGKRLTIAAEVDKERLMTHELHKLRAQKYEELAASCTSTSALKDLSRIMGITGSSPLFRLLPYVDRADVFCLPVYHTAILGVGKAYLRLLVDGPHPLQIASAARNKLDKLSCSPDTWILTLDFGRRPEPLRKIKCFQIEQGMRFIEFYSCFLFNPAVVGVQALADEAKTAWGCLRRYIVYITREVDADNPRFPTSLLAAQKELLQFAKFVQRASVESCPCAFSACPTHLRWHG